MTPQAEPARPTNVAEYLTQRALEQPHAPAVIVQGKRAGEKHEYTSISFGELNAKTQRITHGLHDAGIKAGDRVAVLVTPGFDFFAITFALLDMRAIPVLIDPGIGVKNMGRCLEEAEPHAFIGITKAHMARKVLGWAKSAKIKITVGPRLFWSGKTLEQIEASKSTNPPALQKTQTTDTAAILFTSGSTGAPKGAVYTHGIFLEQIRVLKEVFGIQPGEKDIATFPLFALFGPALGMTAVLPDMDFTRPGSADPEKIAAAIRDHQATNMFGSPALVSRVAKHFVSPEGKASTSFPSLKRVLSAGAPVPASTIERFSKLLAPSVEVFTPYGATEALPVAAIGSSEILNETRHATAQGKGICVGKPVGHARVEVVRISDEPVSQWSDSLKIAEGEIGELVVQGPAVSREYFRRDEANRLSKIPETVDAQTTNSKQGTINQPFWHRMGDVGYRDAQGRLWFCGRKSHRVVTAKETLFTICCEQVYNTHPAVFRTALVGVGKPGAQRPVLCVELEKENGSSNCCGPALEKIKQELLSLGARYPHTSGIKDLLFHPSFPVDIRHNAKIFREKLAVWAEGQLK